MKTICVCTTAAVAFSLATLAADENSRIRELEQRLEELDKKYRALERRLEVQEGAPEAKPKSTPVVSVGSNGVVFSSADTNFVLRIRGELQTDARFYAGDGGNNRNDRFLIRRARPIFMGTLWKDFDFLFLPEFAGGNLASGGAANVGPGNILDAYANYRLRPELQIRVGKFKAPVGLEVLQTDSYLFFTERGLPSDLMPSRDIGIMVHGKLWDSFLSYQVGVFNGIGDGLNSSNIDFDDEKDVAGRVVLQPFRKGSWELAKGLGVGVGGSYGNQDGIAGLPASNGFATEAAQQFFSYYSGSSSTNANVTADGVHWRLSPQAFWYYKSFGLLGEYAISAQDVRRTDAKFASNLHNTAWQIVGGYVLTGEEASYESVVPRHPFSLTDNQWGAFELVARYSRLTIDPRAFPNFASPSLSASKASAFSFGLNWYLNRNIRTSVNYVHTAFKGGDAAQVTAQDENAVISRLQLIF